jgi:hypothetical protein
VLEGYHDEKRDVEKVVEKFQPSGDKSQQLAI